MADAPVLVVERHDQCAVATLSRPETLNSLDARLLADLDATLRRLDEDDSVRAVVLTGRGRGFCSGLDLAEATTLDRLDPATFFRRQDRISRTLTQPFRMRTPVIAAVNGPASGGGLALALASDIRIASPAAEFNVAFVRIGLTGCDVGVSWLLPRIVGLGVASELMLTGRRVDAAQAQRIGLVNDVVPADELLPRALAVAGEIAANSAFGVALTKEGLRLASDATSLETAVGIENRQQALAALGPEYVTAVQSFMARR